MYTYNVKVGPFKKKRKKKHKLVNGIIAMYLKETN